MMLFYFWLVFSLFLDQLSKKIIVELLMPGQTIDVLGNFLMLTNVGNTGISFGMFQGYTHILIPVVSVIIVIVFFVSIKFAKKSPWLAFAFGSIIGGALGNQIDRLFKGAVVDFIYVKGFAVFNVSDSFVVIGAFVLGIHTIFFAEKHKYIDWSNKNSIMDGLTFDIKEGLFNYSGKSSSFIKIFLDWLYHSAGRNPVIFLRQGNTFDINAFCKNAENENEPPILIVQDIINQNTIKPYKSELAEDYQHEVLFVSSVKRFFGNKVLVENDKHFRIDTIYDSSVYPNRLMKNRKDLIKLIILDNKPANKKNEKKRERSPLMNKNDFILEILTEEIPPTEIPNLKKQMEDDFSHFLLQQRIKYDRTSFFYSARRFGVYVENISLKQEDSVELKRGPAKKIAFDSEGNPTKALNGFLRGNNASMDELITKEDNANEYCYIQRHIDGIWTKEILQNKLPAFLQNLNFKKPMRWGNGEYKFVRPVHNVLALLAAEVIPFEFMGKKSCNTTKGHRFKSDSLVIETAAEYFKNMIEGGVLADHKVRKEKIINDIKVVEADKMVSIPYDKELIEEVTAFTEYPNPVFGSYNAKFLDLPPEVLITTLRHHQRTFPVKKNKQLIPNFLSFQDNESASSDNVKAGYRKVIEARLEDALFYYKEDMKHPFSERLEGLKNIGFQNKLGTLYEKVFRVKKLSAQVGKILEMDDESIEAVKRTCDLMKNDLTTHMVYEFPELQGIMGRIYADESGEPFEISHAIEEQYGEGVPETYTGCITSLTDNIDTIAGNLIINNIPSGSKDPFALRRALTRALNIVLAREWDLDILDIFSYAIDAYEYEISEEKKVELNTIFVELLSNRVEYLLSEREIEYDVINATIHLANNYTRCYMAAIALSKAKKEDNLTDIIMIFERIHNISKNHTSNLYESRLFEQDEERELEEKFNDIRDEVLHALDRYDYKSALYKMNELRDSVNSYFENCFVMSDREDLRLTRLGFLKGLDDFFMKIGNLSEIVINKENGHE